MPRHNLPMIKVRSSSGSEAPGVPNNYEVQRHQIQQQVNRYFHGSINIAPRAIAALQGSFRTEWGDLDSGKYAITAASVFEALLTVSPVSLVSLFRAGVPVERLFSADPELGPAPLAESSLEWIFRGSDEGRLLRGADRPARRCKAAARVWNSRTLTETDLLQAFLQTANVGPRHFREKVDIDSLSVYATDVGHRQIGRASCRERGPLS